MKKLTKKEIVSKLLCILLVAVFFALAVGSSSPKSADEWNDWLMEMNDMETEDKKSEKRICPNCGERNCADDKTICEECLEDFQNMFE